MKKLISLFVVLVVTLCMATVPVQALADDSSKPFDLVYANDGGVWDYVTHIEFKKLDKDTSDPINNVHLQILNYKTHQVVSTTLKNGTKVTCDWWTGTDGTQDFDKVLNVYDPNRADETTYILHEVKEKDGYESAANVNDVVFRIKTTDGEITIVDDPDGRAKIHDKQTLILYNTSLMRVTDLNVTEHGQDTVNHVKRSKEGMAQTSDLFNPTMTAVIVLIGAALVILGIKSRSKKQDDEPVAEAAEAAAEQPDDSEKSDD